MRWGADATTNEQHCYFSLGDLLGYRWRRLPPPAAKYTIAGSVNANSKPQICS